MRVHYPVLTVGGIRAIRWTARSLAAIGILSCSFFVLGVLFGGENSKQLPFVLKGSPFGTYAQNTQLGMVVFGAGIVLSGIGAILAFRWEAPAAVLLIVGSVVEAILLPSKISDRTLPLGWWVDGAVLWIFFPLLTSLLLVVVSRKSRNTR